jgi:hypothetical protein
VTQTTTLLLLRLRYHIVTTGRTGDGAPLLAEDCQVVGFRGRPADPDWLAPAEAEALLPAEPDADLTPQQATQLIERILEGWNDLEPALDKLAEKWGQELLDAHRRVRTTRVRHAVRPQLPVDVLGVYVLKPVG